MPQSVTGPRFSRAILIRMLLLAVVAVGIIAWKLDFLYQVYFRDQLTSVGWLVNGAIVLLFLLGIAKMVRNLARYDREERALRDFSANLRLDLPDPTDGLDPERMVTQRYRTLAELAGRGGAIDHSALAAAQVAALSTENSFPKFVNNVLILTGVFGTIVSLSIALVGASDMLGSANATGMSTVIQGMSTALSTTMTAIVCYLYFGYFYLKLTDAQTRLVSALEHLTATAMMPRFQPSPEAVTAGFADLLRATRDLINRLEQSHARLAQAGDHLHTVLEAQQAEGAEVRHALTRVEALLREGFRLPAPQK